MEMFSKELRELDKKYSAVYDRRAGKGVGEEEKRNRTEDTGK